MTSLRQLLLTILTLFCIVSVQATPFPDPIDFGKKVVETIRLNNIDSLIKAFSIRQADWDYLDAEINTYPYLSEDERKAANTFVYFGKQDTFRTTNEMIDSFDKLQGWIHSDSIQISEVKYLETYFELTYVKDAPIYVLRRMRIAIQHRKRYYILHLKDVVYINNRWVFGHIRSIEEVNQYLKPIPSYGISTDTLVESITEDTVLDSTESTYVGLNPKQAKKIARMQKQIDGLNIKMYKEYVKEY